jgi:hypothetical protein
LSLDHIPRSVGDRLVTEVRAEFDVATSWAAADAPRLLRSKTEPRNFPGLVAAAVLNDAVPLRPGPASLHEAFSRFRNGLLTAVLPGWLLDGAAAPRLPVPARKSSADTNNVVLVYENAAAYRLEVMKAVRQTGADIHVTLVASVSAASPERARIARLPVALFVP